MPAPLPPNTLSAQDKEHLARIATTMSWALIARVMKALSWKWYTIPSDRTPSPGDIRDTALQHLTRCIHEARQSPCSSASLHTGGLQYVADVCPDTGEVEELYCAFVLESCHSTDDDEPLQITPTRG